MRGDELCDGLERGGTYGVSIEEINVGVEQLEERFLGLQIGRHVAPRTEEQQSSRELPSSFAEVPRQSEREVSTGVIACGEDLGRGGLERVDEVGVRGDAVEELRGEGALRDFAVVDKNDVRDLGALDDLLGDCWGERGSAGCRTHLRRRRRTRSQVRFVS